MSEQLAQRLEEEVRHRESAISEARARAATAESAAKEAHRRLEETESALARITKAQQTQVRNAVSKSMHDVVTDWPDQNHLITQHTQNLNCFLKKGSHVRNYCCIHHSDISVLTCDVLAVRILLLRRAQRS